MDTNRFKASHDFSNTQKNLSNNPGYHVGSHFQPADMKSQNQETLKNGFMTRTQKSAKDVWVEIQQMNSIPWNKNQR